MASRARYAEKPGGDVNDVAAQSTVMFPFASGPTPVKIT
jgi:hypothetical protein